MKKTKDVWKADLGDGTFQNPIIHADYSDPDVIRVGEDFFMVSSSFNMSPCLPLLHSKDLVNWKIVNHVSETFPYDRYNKPRHGEGVWAPSIRYHAGKFWVFFGAPDEGIFMSHTEDPFGEWSPLHLVKEVKGWIDPCPFWDDDGQAYLVNAFARSRIGFKHILNIAKMKPDGTALLDEGTYIFDGTEHHPTIEGPKMYKRNGYYYIFAPAGGVTTGWQTILRSKTIYGPYEDKIVLHQGDTDINGPHQGGWVELESGESWFLHFQDKDAYGRIVHMQPMTWENDWPVMGHNQNEDGVGEPVLTWKKPTVESVQNEIFNPQTSDDFEGEKLGLQWQWRANIQHSWYSLGEKENHLRLFAKELPEGVETFYDTPQILTQKFPAPAFTATSKMEFHPEEMADVAGLIVVGFHYAGLMVKKGEDGLQLVHFSGEQDDDITAEREEVVKTIDAETFYLRVDVTEEKGKAKCQFTFSVDGESFENVGGPFTATIARWIGAQVGIFCLNRGKQTSKGFVDVDWFNVQ
ncbi:glycoside hydrolase family 43 protein [Halalkalibacter urbisdiaboli]|uniref:glycoside hydrolase family 43 protein n=1 Tax=Halalkalibacter urbisdiaboli TaxID=1960589 RepID=UPI000B43A3B3|nr:glycoside hydrolase 43 family protein [Halalkalibacter urbisdiaboli]